MIDQFFQSRASHVLLLLRSMLQGARTDSGALERDSSRRARRDDRRIRGLAAEPGFDSHSSSQVRQSSGPAVQSYFSAVRNIERHIARAFRRLNDQPAPVDVNSRDRSGDSYERAPLASVASSRDAQSL